MEAADLFPLRLTPFEEYMVKDSYRAYPMVFGVRLFFDGRLEADRLQNAFRLALARHPLLSSTIRRVGRHRHVWEWDSALPLDFSTAKHLDDDTRSFPERDVPLLSEHTGLRVRVMGSDDTQQDTLSIQFHHVCCDGGGAFQFLEDVLVAYHFGEDVREHHMAAIDLASLPRRHRRCLQFSARMALVWRQCFGIEGARKFFVRRPRPLVNQVWPALDQAPPADFTSAIADRLSAQELDSLALCARTLSVTTHELITRELFLTIRDFQQTRGTISPTKWTRLNIPMNLRRAEHTRTPAANIVSMVFLDRKAKHMKNERKLLASIQGEMSRIKRFDVKYTYIYLNQLLHLLPGGYELVTRSRKCHATMVLTNLGRVLADLPVPTREGALAPHNLVLRNVDLIAPYRPLCNAAIALVNYADGLTTSLHYDSRALSRADAQSLSNGFLARLRQLVQ